MKEQLTEIEFLKEQLIERVRDMLDLRGIIQFEQWEAAFITGEDWADVEPLWEDLKPFLSPPQPSTNPKQRRWHD